MWKWKFGLKILNLNLSFFVRSYSGAEALREICIFFFMKYLGIIMVNFLRNQVNLLNFTTERQHRKRKFSRIISIKSPCWLLFVGVTYCDRKAPSGLRMSAIDIFRLIPSICQPPHVAITQSNYFAPMTTSKDAFSIFCGSYFVFPVWSRIWALSLACWTITRSKKIITFALKFVCAADKSLLIAE